MKEDEGKREERKMGAKKYVKGRKKIVKTRKTGRKNERKKKE